jgi:hypothetical protein
MAWDVGAIVVLVNACTGVAHGARMVPQSHNIRQNSHVPVGTPGMPDRQAAQALDGETRVCSVRSVTLSSSY